MQTCGKILRGEKILSPPWFQHCGGERPRRPRRSDASASHDTNWTELEKLLCPRPTAEEALSDTEIRPSVCSVEQLAACSLATAGHQRCADCGPVRGWT